MDDLISRQAAIDSMCRTYCSKWRCHASSCKGVQALKDLPAQQAKTAEWLPCNEHAVICSSCGVGAPHMYPYCNYCGAWMRNHDRKYDVRVRF